MCAQCCKQPGCHKPRPVPERERNQSCCSTGCWDTWSVLASPFSAGLFPSLPASAFPFFPLGTFSLFCKCKTRFAVSSWARGAAPNNSTPMFVCVKPSLGYFLCKFCKICKFSVQLYAVMKQLHFLAAQLLTKHLVVVVVVIARQCQTSSSISLANSPDPTHLWSCFFRFGLWLWRSRLLQGRENLC